MFRLRKPAIDEIEREVFSASLPGRMQAEYLDASAGLRRICLPNGFVMDRLRTEIGNGEEALHEAVRAFERWTQFDVGWARVANSSARIELGQIIVFEVHFLGLWSLNLSQIVEVIQTETRFGFIYKTTEEHVEEGEERFLLGHDRETGAVWYETEAVSRPRHLLTLVGYPATRQLQHRFVRGSHRRMREAVSGLR